MTANVIKEHVIILC